jgi:hypothetical protein
MDATCFYLKLILFGLLSQTRHYGGNQGRLSYPFNKPDEVRAGHALALYRQLPEWERSELDISFFSIAK